MSSAAVVIGALRGKDLLLSEALQYYLKKNEMTYSLLILNYNNTKYK